MGKIINYNLNIEEKDGICLNKCESMYKKNPLHHDNYLTQVCLLKALFWLEKQYNYFQFLPHTDISERSVWLEERFLPQQLGGFQPSPATLSLCEPN